jgi:hypothetical protein
MFSPIERAEAQASERAFSPLREAVEALADEGE